MTPEGKVKNLVKGILDEAKAYYHMPVQNGMGKPSLDFIVCHRGRFIAIETKTAKGDPTLRQKMTMDEMQAAGAIVIVVRGTGDAESLTYLKNMLELI